MVERTFELPDLGEGIAEGELVSWAVAAGDAVEEDQLLAEVETDKALVEIPSPYEGTVKRLHHEEGEIIPVDSVIATFEVEGDEPSETVADDASGGDAGGASPDAARESFPDDDGDASAEPPAAVGEASVPSGRVFAAPSTRSLARELGVDIGAIDGSGPGGRVAGADVRAHANGQPTAPTTGADVGTPEEERSDAAAAAASTTQAEDVDDSAGAAAAVQDGVAAARDRTLAMPATRRLADELGVDLNAVPASEEREGEPFATPEDVRQYAAGDRGTAGGASAADEAPAAATATTAGSASGDEERAVATDIEARSGERVPYRGVRRTIGEQMAHSKYTAPHVSHHDEFDATDLVGLRAELAAAAEDEGVKLTYLPLVVKAITTALQEYPYLNSSLDEANEEIVLHDEYNIGIAVATDAGLMVPVVKNADEKGLKQLAKEIRDLADRARDRKIKPEEMRGGTFTITNIGVIGGEFSSPIINHPEAAIFAMGPIRERPWVVDGDVVARETMRFSMSVDHRLVDGADAAQFSNRVKELLAEPSRLLLE
ncbi:2-oxo acid dehydrogenase subunit E2 [Halobellus sp. GM3]|uniref:2-oxo acid dehydrogenase subunit E2 n=1 Tax=Halobellus sp. GM3 TaxID=3458410 RepID=UPI00403D5E60